MKRNAPKTLRRDAGLLRRDTAGARRATFRLVTPVIDRHGTIILPEGVKLDSHKRAGSPFLWMHQSGDGFSAPPPDVLIGKVVEYVQSPQALDITAEFFDDGPGGLATKCWDRVQAGLLRSVSIGCAVLRAETRQVDGRAVEVYTETELWEASLVIIGSNPEALRLDRAAALRALDSLKETKRMDKQALCKMLGIDEGADRETAEKALVKYLCETSDDVDARKAAAAALDEHFPESASGEDLSRAEGEVKDEEMEALKGALEETRAALVKAQAAQVEAPKVADEAAKREAALAKDVQRWIDEGRIPTEKRDHYLKLHRANKAAGVIKHLPPGTFTTAQRLASGKVGTPVKVPELETTAKADPGKELVQRFAAQGAAELGLKVKN